MFECVGVCVYVCVCVCGPPSCVTAQRGLANLLVRVDYKANRRGVGGGERTTFPRWPSGQPRRHAITDLYLVTSHPRAWPTFPASQVKKMRQWNLDFFFPRTRTLFSDPPNYFRKTKNPVGKSTIWCVSYSLRLKSLGYTQHAAGSPGEQDTAKIAYCIIRLLFSKLFCSFLLRDCV